MWKSREGCNIGKEVVQEALLAWAWQPSPHALKLSSTWVMWNNEVHEVKSIRPEAQVNSAVGRRVQH